jgi:hypothetical protein
VIQSSLSNRFAGMDSTASPRRRLGNPLAARAAAVIRRAEGPKSTTARKAIVSLASAMAVLIGLGLVAPSAAQAALPAGYSDVPADVACNMTMDQYNRIYQRSIIPHTPGMTSPRSNQTISWQPILFRYYNGAWRADVTGPELKGTFNGLYSVLPSSPGFTINKVPAYYRVAVRYRWYWNGAVEQSDYQWAGTHFQTYVRTYPGGTWDVWRGDSGSYCKLV